MSGGKKYVQISKPLASYHVETGPKSLPTLSFRFSIKVFKFSEPKEN